MNMTVMNTSELSTCLCGGGRRMMKMMTWRAGGRRAKTNTSGAHVTISWKASSSCVRKRSSGVATAVNYRNSCATTKPKQKIGKGPRWTEHVRNPFGASSRLSPSLRFITTFAEGQSMQPEEVIVYQNKGGSNSFQSNYVETKKLMTFILPSLVNVLSR